MEKNLFFEKFVTELDRKQDNRFSLSMSSEFHNGRQTYICSVKSEHFKIKFDLMDAYKKCPDESLIERFAEGVAKTIICSTNAIDSSDYESVKNLLTVEIKNKEDFPEKDKFPHIIIDDFVFIFGIVIEKRAISLINNELLKKYGVSKERLMKDALTNWARLHPVGLYDLLDMTLFLLGGKEMPDNHFEKHMSDKEAYVLTSVDENYCVNGAVALFCDGIMEKIANVIGSFYAIPSSVHEWMIVADDGIKDFTFLQEILRTTNQNSDIIKREDVLSDFVYYYDAEKKFFSKLLL